MASFDTNLSKQIKDWRGAGERIVLAIDMNNHPLHNDLYQPLQDQGTEMEEFSHKCWGPKAPYTHSAGKSPIDEAYKSLEVETTSLCMLTFAESPADHKSLCFDISTPSLLVEFRYKICCPVSRRLVISQQSSVKRYNTIVCNSPHCGENGHCGQDDPILWIPPTRLALSNDHQAAQTDDKDQGACWEEV